MDMIARTAQELYNRPTSYEVVLIDNGVSTHIGFTARKTNVSIMKFAQKASDKIIARMDELGCADNTKPSKGEWNFGKGLIVRFSGRTEREFAL